MASTTAESSDAGLAVHSPVVLSSDGDGNDSNDESRGSTTMAGPGPGPMPREEAESSQQQQEHHGKADEGEVKEGQELLEASEGEGGLPVDPEETEAERLRRIKANQAWWYPGSTLVTDAQLLQQDRELQREYSHPSERTCLQIIFDPSPEDFKCSAYFVCAGPFFMPLIALMLLRGTQFSFLYLRLLPKWYVNPFIHLQWIMILAFMAVTLAQGLFILLFGCCIACVSGSWSGYIGQIRARMKRILRALGRQPSTPVVQAAEQHVRSSYSQHEGLCGLLILILMVFLFGYYYFGVLAVVFFSLMGVVFWIPVQIIVFLSALLHFYIGQCIENRTARAPVSPTAEPPATNPMAASPENDASASGLPGPPTTGDATTGTATAATAATVTDSVALGSQV